MKPAKHDAIDFDPLPSESDAPEQAPKYSEEDLALAFAAAHANDLRYVAEWGHWLVWNGQRWVRDKTLATVEQARIICRQFANELEASDSTAAASRAAKRLASSQSVAAVERLARADRRLAASTDQWDCDAFLLNTPCGTIDLRIGSAREHQRTDYITKIAAVGPAGDCPQWKRLLARITDGNAQLQQFIQRIAGYALTGSTKEHSLFFLYGTGANGKSVLLNTISGVLDEYATTAPMETFVASNSDRHPTDLAGLRGARLVTAIETEEGRRWAESKVKSLTGGDKIAARFMRQDFFEFAPQFKLVIAGNHKPALRGVDEAMRRRMNLIPFTVTIPPAERDPALFERLKAEWPGILQWMIEGCLAWQANGLEQPDIVRAATDDYLESEDAISQWLGECCEVEPGYSLVCELFPSWKSWAESRGEYVGSQKRLSQALRDRGFLAHKEGGTGRAGFRGLTLRRHP